MIGTDVMYWYHPIKIVQFPSRTKLEHVQDVKSLIKSSLFEITVQLHRGDSGLCEYSGGQIVWYECSSFDLISQHKPEVS